MTHLKKYIFMFIIFVSKNSYAQNNFNDSPSMEPDAIGAPGVERVGSVPLPIRNDRSRPLTENTQIEEFSRTRPVKKNFYESTFVSGRILYLNGENINSIREQELENVNVRIDKNGNIYILAPQYEVSTEQSYHPLLPKELPKFKKENSLEQMPVPQGTYSKQTGKPVAQDEPAEHSAQSAPTMPKEIIPEANTQAKIPQVNMDGIKPPSGN